MKIVKKVGAIVKNNLGEILIFKEKLSGKDFLFNIPKGTFNKLKESSLSDSIKREIYEETNLKNIKIEKTLDLIFKYYEDKISILVLFLIFVKEIDDLSNKNIENNENIKDYKWINKKEFSKMNKEDFIDDRIYNIIYNYFYAKNN